MTSHSEEDGRELTLPSNLCRRYNLTPHTPLQLVATRNGILIVPLTPTFQCPAVTEDIKLWQLPNTRSVTLLPDLASAPTDPVYESLLHILRQLQASDLHVREAALGAVVALGASAVAPLRQAARQGDEDFRWKVAEALGEISDPDAVPQLLEALKDPGDEIRQHAARALARMEDSRSVSGFIALLADANATLRLVAAETLGRLRDTAAVPALLHALEDSQDEVRWEAADALEAMQDESVIADYEAALAAVNGVTRAEIVRLLGALGGEACLSPLIQRLLDAEENVRCAAVDALGRLGDERGVEPLLLAAEQDTPGVRLRAVQALSGFGDADTLCRRMIASRTLSATERLRALRFLMRASHYEHQTAVRYLLSDITGYCAELATEDAEAGVRAGAEEVLAALAGETLLRGAARSQQQDETQLLRPLHGSSPSVAPETLVRPIAAPVSPNDGNATPLPAPSKENGRFARFLRRM